MSVCVKDLREQRARLIHQARAAFDQAEKAKREPTTEERRNFDIAMADADELERQIETREGQPANVESRGYVERLEAAEKSLSESRGRQTEPDQPGRLPGESRATGHDSREYRAAYASYLCHGYNQLCPTERRALSASNDVQGGYLAAPMQFVPELIKAVDNAVVIRQLATKFNLQSAQSLGVPSLDADPDDADWTAELATGNEDSTMSFGRRELHPHALAMRLKVSSTLLRVAAMAEVVVRDRLAYKIAVSQEKAYMTGDGAGKPLGVFVASADGVPTSRDVSTGMTSTEITADGLINVKYSLKEPYLRSDKLRWIFHRDAVKAIRKFKDGNNQYIWMPGLGGTPDTLLDIPLVMSEYAPNTFTTGLYVGIIGDFSNYWIADAMSIQIKRLDELYAETNQTGFISRLETDGMPVLGEAFARVKLA